MVLVAAANRIQGLRRARGLTQRQLAELAGVPVATVTYADKPASMPKLDTAVKIAKALGVAAEDLLAAAR